MHRSPSEPRSIVLSEKRKGKDREDDDETEALKPKKVRCNVLNILMTRPDAQPMDSECAALRLSNLKRNQTTCVH